MAWIKKYKGYLFLGLGLVGLLAFNLPNILSGKPVMDPYSEILTTSSRTDQTLFVVVEVRGAVQAPGLYEVSSDLRVGDVIMIAGGLKDNADLASINQAERITDAMIIDVPSQSQSWTTLPPAELVRIVVEIKGEVKYPGIYTLYKNARVYDLVDKAGGLTQNADISGIDMAKTLYDGDTIRVPAKPMTSSITTMTLRVEIKGEVMTPGVYTLSSDARLFDLVTAAGGFLDTAAIDSLNLARLLVDGESVLIPKIDVDTTTVSARDIYVEIVGEVIHPGVYQIAEDATIRDLIYAAGGVTVDCDLSKILWNTPLLEGAVIYIPSHDDGMPSDNSGLININTADLETLVTLPGIGDILGQRIIDYRAEYGSFLCIEDIMNVSGIKESVYEQIKDLIAV